MPLPTPSTFIFRATTLIVISLPLEGTVHPFHHYSNDGSSTRTAHRTKDEFLSRTLVVGGGMSCCGGPRLVRRHEG